MPRYVPVVAGCAILISGLMAAPTSAHVVLDTREAPAGSYFKGLFRIGHGCGTSPTVRVTVQIPSGILSVRPQPKAGWTIDIRKKTLPEPVTGPHGKTVTEVVSEIVWHGGSLPNEHFDEFALQMKLPDAAEGGVLAFPVIQDCEQGSRAWVEVPKPGQSRRDLTSPAPILTLTAKPHAHKH
ncbi:YcnI family protein [Thalassospiraceae bacterium LMO-SO8]|nr:YcnI family protein [Alphaproteobacteria bacterium LMO-S08]WND74570.1 YcnI family protein [Thalassospiraceae bacterium LMO-SO8]